MLTYKQWKRKFVTCRGVKNGIHDTNGVFGSWGNGLYTCPLSNKQMAKTYGKLYFVVNGKPKNPKKFQYVNSIEIFRQRFNNDAEMMQAELIRAGFDGIEIEGREFCNYAPQDVRYFETERELELFFESIEGYL